MEHAAALIAEAPERYPALSSDPRARRLVVEGFPFSVVYTFVGGKTVFIVAIAHYKRRPRYLAQRFDDTPDERSGRG